MPRRRLPLLRETLFINTIFARSLLGLRRFEEAVKASKEAIRLSDGKYDYMHFTLASAYFESGNWRAAAQSYEKAAEMDPKDDAAPYNIAPCYARLGHYPDAA